MTHTILIVEDFKTFNNALAKHLAGQGHRVVQAFTLAEANERLGKEEFDLILLDMILPDGNGDEIVYQLRYGLEAKIVVLTGHDDAQLREHLFSHGILDYISKENNYDFILSELAEILEELEQNRKIRLMVVDDSGFVRNMVTEVLRIRNYTVFAETNGRACLETLERETVDLLLLDLEMPEMNGEQVIKKLRKNSNLLQLPIVVLSGSSDKNMISRVLKHGANDYIPKPFSIEELVLKVKNFIKLSRMQQELNLLNKEMERRVEEEVARRREGDRMLIHQSRLAAMGEMIGNIAHQWRQPLNALGLVIQGVPKAWARGKLDDEYVEKNARKGMMLIRKMSETIDDFRNFFQPEKEKRLFLASERVEEAFNLVEGSMAQREIQVTVTGNLDVEIYGFPGEFSQVIVNLLANARDAIETRGGEGGRVEVRLESFVNGAVISVEDDGGGIPMEIMPRIFDPYFTTKEEGKGTGVGLYMSKMIVEENMNGKLEAVNTEQGVRFTVTIPHQEKEQEGS